MKKAAAKKAAARKPAPERWPVVREHLKKYWHYYILALAVFAAYSNVYGNAFLYDDEALILKNTFLRDWDHIGAIFSASITAGAHIPGGFYRPVQILLYLLIYQAFGDSSFAFHLLNVALHTANACLIYRFGKKLRFNPAVAFSTTLLWALHPMQVEAITYVSGTADPLFVFFVLLGLLVIVPRFQPQRILASIPLFILALLSKEEAIIFPLLVASCIFLLDRERLRPKTYLRLAPLFIVAALYYIAHNYFLGFGGYALYQQDDAYANSILCRIYTFLATLPYYLGILVWPVHLHYDRDFKYVTDLWNLPVMAGIGMIGIAATQIILGRNRRALAFSWGLLWFAAAHLLHTGILKPVNASLLEHWLYLPSIGLFLGTGQSLASIKWQRQQRKRYEIGLLAVVALTLGIMSYEQNEVWHDAETFYLNIFKNGEPSPRAHGNLGVLYALSGRYDEALEQYDLAIKYSGDNLASAHHDLAITLLNGPHGKDFTQEAIRHLKRALEIDPDYYAASLALAAVYKQMGDTSQAAYYSAWAASTRKKMTGQ